MSDKVYNTLFLCTGNSARSIMAEALLNSFGHDRFKAFSAGSRPGSHVNPLALDILQATRLPIDGLRSKSWDEFARPGAAQMDFVIRSEENTSELQSQKRISYAVFCLTKKNKQERQPLITY